MACVIGQQKMFTHLCDHIPPPVCPGVYGMLKQVILHLVLQITQSLKLPYIKGASY